MLHAVLRAAGEAGEATPNPVIPAWYDIIWSSVCFVIILVFFWKYVLPRVQKLLDERAEAIEGNIAKADEAQRKAEAALEEYTAQLADARAEAGRIRETAREDGKKIVNEAKDQAVTEAARVTSSAQAQIEAERQQALVSLRSEVGTIAIDLASGVVGETLSDDAKAKAVVDRFLADLEAEQASAGGKK
ncbi:F0F1 ATP synthase subunit B [Agromyces aerolatus]|uniref:F0F1 ATP synthase subunit B n=1 Tax=Agromyces sp. LY-1074 TaxID=3074080 RepID=UPI002865D010|nr:MULTISPECIES: F0F1 ATP synthase subunit B [unclassified Agromyces]MDR5701287.1 F0F1 ATP synthase subunit B [Agromyces sp. LY-1074]MDR5707545.1 F0F1 ATP synthase subunit B [Agromyces sp. LY-1358]